MNQYFKITIAVAIAIVLIFLVLTYFSPTQYPIDIKSSRTPYKLNIVGNQKLILETTSTSTYIAYLESGQYTIKGTYTTPDSTWLAYKNINLSQPTTITLDWHEYQKEVVHGSTYSYTIVNAQFVKGLMTSNTKYLIIEVGHDKAHYKQGHIEGATYASCSERTALFLFQNVTDNLIIYSVDDALAIEFCTYLFGRTNSTLYVLEGGYEDWLSIP